MRDTLQFKYANTSVGAYLGKIPISVPRWRDFPLARQTFDSWEATGPAREVFNQIRSELCKYLRDNDPELGTSSDVLLITLRMIGKTKCRSKPTVIITSEDKKRRARAFSLIKNNGLMDKFDGFGLLHASREDQFSRIELLAGTETGQERSTDIHIADHLESAQEHEPLRVPIEALFPDSISPSTGLSGLSIWPKASPNSQPPTQKATAGYCCRYNGKYFLVTVCHFLTSRPANVLGRTSLQVAGIVDEDTNHEVAESFGLEDLDWEPDMDEYIVSEGMSTGTSLFASAQASSPPWGRNEVLTTSHDQISESAQRSGDLPRVDRRLEEPSGNPTYIGDLIAMCSHLDYSVIQLLHTGNVDDKHSLIIDIGNSSPPILQEATDSPISVLVSSTHAIIGKLSGTTCSIQFPQSSGFQDVMRVQLQEPLRPGDCGSLVIEIGSGKVVGHIIAGSQTSGIAFVMPAKTVIEHLTLYLQRQDIHKLTSGDVARWKSPILLTVFFLIGLALSLAHCLFYYKLDAKIVGSASQQENNLRYVTNAVFKHFPRLPLFPGS